jgi:CubicO group peptidase (beta-lactamase class C family)
MKSIHDSIQSLLDQFIANGSERGLQVAVYRHGQLIANCFAGTTDATGQQRVDARTLFPVFSTTKGIAATLVHQQVERGKIAYGTPIAEVWPEFAAHGKGNITLRHALNHSAGLPFMPTGIDHATLGDWKKSCAAIAALDPATPPGQVMVYHAITYGWLVGEPICRVDGRTFGQLLHDEITAPLGIADEMFVGTPESVDFRVAVLEMDVNEAEMERLRADPAPQAIPALVQPLHEWMNRADARRACLPASNGIMTARAIARHYAALLPGGVDGVELLPPSRIALACEAQKPANYKEGDPLPGHRLGYSMDGFLSSKSFGHGGHGGSLGFADPVTGIAFGFTRNRYMSDATLKAIVDLLRQELKA